MLRTHINTLLLATAGALPALAQTCPPWEVVPTPNAPGAVQSVIRDIDAIAPNDVWAVGSHHNNSRITQMAMHWNGSSWTFFDVPVYPYLPGGSGYLWAVAAAGPNDVWAAGDGIRTRPDGFSGTAMLVVHWDGTRWNLMDTPTQSGGSGDHINDIRIVGPNEIWFVGAGFPVPAGGQPPLAMRWRSGSFEMLNPPVLNDQFPNYASGNSFHAIDSLSPTDVWVVGAGGDGDPVTDVSQILHWDGSTWQHRPGPIPGDWHELDAVVALSPTDVWAGGYYFDGDYHGLAMHWNGSSWIQVPAPDSINGFVAFAPDDIFTSGGTIMHWDGVVWSIVETFPTVDSPSLTGIDALGPCEMWTAGRQIIGESILNFAACVTPGNTCPADPTGLATSEASPGTAALTWLDNASNETGYRVERERRIGGAWSGAQVVATLGPGATSFNDTPGRGAWRYRVQALGSGCDSAWTVYAPVRPASPSGVNAANAGGATQVLWNDNSLFESRFTVQRQQRVGSAWTNTTTAATPPRDSTSYLDSPGPGHWRYRVRCASPAGSSAWSSSWAVVTLP